MYLILKGSQVIALHSFTIVRLCELLVWFC